MGWSGEPGGLQPCGARPQSGVPAPRPLPRRPCTHRRMQGPACPPHLSSSVPPPPAPGPPQPLLPLPDRRGAPCDPGSASQCLKHTRAELPRIAGLEGCRGWGRGWGPPPRSGQAPCLWQWEALTVPRDGATTPCFRHGGHRGPALCPGDPSSGLSGPGARSVAPHPGFRRAPTCRLVPQRPQALRGRSGARSPGGPEAGVTARTPVRRPAPPTLCTRCQPGRGSLQPLPRPRAPDRKGSSLGRWPESRPPPPSWGADSQVGPGAAKKKAKL